MFIMRFHSDLPPISNEGANVRSAHIDGVSFAKQAETKDDGRQSTGNSKQEPIHYLRLHLASNSIATEFAIRLAHILPVQFYIGHILH